MFRPEPFPGDGPTKGPGIAGSWTEWPQWIGGPERGAYLPREEPCQGRGNKFPAMVSRAPRPVQVLAREPEWCGGKRRKGRAANCEKRSSVRCKKREVLRYPAMLSAARSIPKTARISPALPRLSGIGTGTKHSKPAPALWQVRHGFHLACTPLRELCNADNHPHRARTGSGSDDPFTIIGNRCARLKIPCRNWLGGRTLEAWTHFTREIASSAIPSKDHQRARRSGVQAASLSFSTLQTKRRPSLKGRAPPRSDHAVRHASWAAGATAFAADFFPLLRPAGARTAPGVAAGFGSATLALPVFAAAAFTLTGLTALLSVASASAGEVDFAFVALRLRGLVPSATGSATCASEATTTLAAASGSRAIRRFLVATGFTGSAGTVVSTSNAASCLTLREARAGLLFASAASVVSTAGCTSAAGGEAVVAATELLSVRAFDLRATLFAVTLEATGAAYSFAAAGAASYASDSGRLVDAHPVWI